MEVEVAFRVRVEVVPVVRFLTTFSRPSTARTAHLQALLDALVADPPRLERVADLLGRQAVLRLLRGHQEEEDEGMYAEIAALLRPLVAGLPEDARGWLVPALSHWAWLPHTEDGSTLLAARRDAAVERLRAVGLAPARVPRGGYSLWIPLPVAEDQLLPALVRDGVHVTPGSVYHAAEPDRPSLRISLAGADVPTLLDGVDRLGRAVAALA
jgi:hypothetical protein